MSTRFSRNLFRLVTGREPAPSRRRTRSAFYRGPSRDAAYLGWIRSLRCCACGRAPRSEAAHVGRDGGKGIKANDYSAIPLCHRCHRTGAYSYHAGKQTFAAMYCLDYDALVQKYNAIWEQLQGAQIFAKGGK